MTRKEALDFVDAEIKRIGMANLDKELRPWERDVCPAAQGILKPHSAEDRFQEAVVER